MKRSPIRRRPKADPVSQELHAAVLVRDRMCTRFRFDPTHECRNQWGTPHRPGDLERLQLDHVQDGGGRMGKRAPSDLGHLVSLCASAHLEGWATANRPILRQYLARANEHAHVEPVHGCPACRAAVGSEK